MTHRMIFGIAVKDLIPRRSESLAETGIQGDYWPSDYRDDNHWEVDGQTVRDDWCGSD